jgi:thioredoxin 1
MSESVLELKADTWMSEVEKTGGIMLVYFWAPWCGHCKLFSPTFEEVAAEMAGKARFAKLNCDEQTSVAVQCKVTGTPTVIIYINGKEADRIVGGQGKDALNDLINKRLGK